MNDKNLGACEFGVFTANTLTSRLLGLFSKKARAYDAIKLTPCRSIHTFFMREIIDVYFLDDKDVVIHSVRNMKANRMAYCKGASSTLEIIVKDQHKTFEVGERIHG